MVVVNRVGGGLGLGTIAQPAALDLIINSVAGLGYLCNGVLVVCSWLSFIGWFMTGGLVY